VEPAIKTLACGEVGVGALADLDDLVGIVVKCLAPWNAHGGISTKNGVSNVEVQGLVQRTKMDHVPYHNVLPQASRVDADTARTTA